MSETNNEVAVRNDNRSMAISDTLVPRNLMEVKELASFLAVSDLIPKSLCGRKENVALVLLMGHEIGCGGVAALRNIYVVNGRPAIYGDLATALIRKSGLCEELEYKFEGTGANLKCIATGKRKGMKNEHTEEFSYNDAVFGGLVERNPNYKKFPKDMVMWKALHRLFKFLWPDVLHGISIKETVMDDVQEAEIEMGKVEILESTPAKPEPKVPAPAEPTAEELLKKAEEAKARVADEEAKEKAKAERKAKKAEKPAPAADPVDVPPATEAELADEPPAEEVAAVPVNRHIGTLMTAVRLPDPKTATPLGFAIKVQTADGELKFKMASEAEARAAKEFVNKTVEVIWEKMEKSIDGVVGQCAKLTAVNP